MSEFSVVWSRRFLENRRDPEASRWLLEANLTERIILAGKPELRTASRIGAIIEDRVRDVSAADAFWFAALTKLSRLRRLSLHDRGLLERELAERIPRPMPLVVRSPESSGRDEPVRRPAC